MSTQPMPWISPKQYLEMERAAEHRSEYIGGQMYAMSGASLNHDRISSNVLFQIRLQLGDGPCEVRTCDFRFEIPAFGVYTYPDASVFCGPPQLTDEREDTALNPKVVVEVLSPSTRNYDRGEKFRYYRSMPSLAEYLILEQSEMFAELHSRQPDGSWVMREFASPDAVIELASIGVALKLADLYVKVRL